MPKKKEEKVLSLFTAQVYSVAMAIPRGKVTTYGEIAKAVGRPGAARAVGNALRHNSYNPIVPCHRIVRQDRSVGGFTGNTDPHSEAVSRKLNLLKQDGVIISEGTCHVDESCVLSADAFKDAICKQPQELIDAVNRAKKEQV